MKQKETKNRMGTMDIGISGTDADGGSRNRNRCRNQCAIGKEHRSGKQAEAGNRAVALLYNRTDCRCAH